MTVIAFRSRKEIIIRKNSSKFVKKLKEIDSMTLERVVGFVKLGWSFADTFCEPVGKDNLFLVEEELKSRMRARYE